MPDLRQMMAGDRPVCAPLVLNPLMAKLAEQAGFRALYLGGGASGYMKVHLEANLTLTEMAQAGIEIRTVSALPLILDAAAGWGDPMHIHRTMAMAEAAGFAACRSAGPSLSAGFPSPASTSIPTRWRA